MLTRKWRLHQSSRVKLPSVNKSASWFLMSTYLFGMLGDPKWLCQTTNLTQLYGFWIGLRPLMTILITASLSSKIYNCASHWEELAIVRTWSISDKWSTFRLVTWCWNFASSVLLLPGLMIFCHSRNVTLLSPHPIGQKQGFRPFANQHPTK